VTLPGPLYAAVRRLVPIACVDALPYRERDGAIEIGLIRRRLADGRGTGWNLVGGAVRRGEPLADALARHLRATLGPGAAWTLPDTERPVLAAEYFPRPEPPRRRDPRKHAIALSYLVAVAGDVTAAGEALEFRWFAPDARPADAEVGFDQGDVIAALVRALPRAG